MRISKLMLIALLPHFMTSEAGAAEREVYVYTVDQFEGHPGACQEGESFNDRSYREGRVLYDAAGRWGMKRMHYTNNHVNFRDWADSSQDGWGKDHIGADRADVGMLVTHGGTSCSGEHVRFLMGDTAASCDLYAANSSSNDIEWGDLDLNVVILATCESVQKCSFENSNLKGGAKNLNIINGYHGTMIGTIAQRNRFRDNYVDVSRYSGVGNNWVTGVTKFKLILRDICATSIVFGKTQADRDYIFDNGGLEDWKINTATNKTAFYYIEGCDPAHGEKL